MAGALIGGLRTRTNSERWSSEERVFVEGTSPEKIEANFKVSRVNFKSHLWMSSAFQGLQSENSSLFRSSTASVVGITLPTSRLLSRRMYSLDHRRGRWSAVLS